MCTRAVTITVLLMAAATVASAQVRVNEISPGRGQELLRMQQMPDPVVQSAGPSRGSNPGRNHGQDHDQGHGQGNDHDHNDGSRPHKYPFERVYPYVGYYGGYGYPFDYYNGYYNNYGGYYSGYYQPAVVSTAQVVQVPQQTAQPPHVNTELEDAMDALQAGRTSVAIDRFLEHFKTNPDDFVSMRLLGLMYLEEKQPSEAASRIAFAYKRMPELARRPIDVAELGLDSGRVREMLLRASKYANRMKTGSSWLLVTVLSQAEGRTSVALANLVKAEAAGFDPTIVAALRTAMAPMETEQIPVADPLKEFAPPANEQKRDQVNPKNP